jgi:hypothetical protein
MVNTHSRNEGEEPVLLSERFPLHAQPPLPHFARRHEAPLPHSLLRVVLTRLATSHAFTWESRGICPSARSVVANNCMCATPPVPSPVSPILLRLIRGVFRKR